MSDVSNTAGPGQAADQTQTGRGRSGTAPQNKVEQVRRTVTERANAARDWAGEQASVARDWAADQTDALRDTVQTRPFVAVGVSAGTAFAAGLVLGILLARR